MHAQKERRLDFCDMSSLTLPDLKQSKFLFRKRSFQRHISAFISVKVHFLIVTTVIADPILNLRESESNLGLITFPFKA